MTAVWVGVLVLLVLLAFSGMWRGWRARAARQADLPEPQWLGGRLAATDLVDVTYVSTTTGGHWMDRIAAHGLGTLGPAQVGTGEGDLLVVRDGAAGFRIPAVDLLGVRRQRGIAGKVREPDGIVVVSWQLGDHELDTGLRPRLARDAERVVGMVEGLMDAASRNGADHV